MTWVDVSDVPAQCFEFPSAGSTPQHVRGPARRMDGRSANTQDGALAGAVGAEHGPVFATVHGEGNPLKDLLSVTSKGHVLQFEDGGRCGVDFQGGPRGRRLTAKTVLMG